MSETTDSGSVFPSLEVVIAEREDSKGPYTAVTGETHGGMSLRDYFAAQALPAVIAKGDPSLVVGNCGEIYAPMCYAIADAMLTARR